MHPAKRSLLWLNLVGGSAVLASYAWGAASGGAGALWGGVPEGLQSLYVTNMLLAAAGYFAFGYLVFFRVDPDRVRNLPGGLGFRALHVLYALVLVPSALWLPMTRVMLEAPNDLLWWQIRAVLFAVALGSLGILAFVLRQPAERTGAVAKALAVAGAVAFCSQTALLDALIWPAYFSVPAGG